MIYLILRLLLYSPVFIVERWKNTLFLGIDACFKLKLKDRKLKDPDLSAGLAFMVNESSYQKYLNNNSTIAEPVRLLQLTLVRELTPPFRSPLVVRTSMR